MQHLDQAALALLGKQVDLNTLGPETPDEKKAAIKGLRTVLKAGDLVYDKELLKKAVKLGPRAYEIAGAGPFSIHMLDKLALVRVPDAYSSESGSWATLRDPHPHRSTRGPDNWSSTRRARDPPSASPPHPHP